ncbi:MAG: ABC transporter ATP-binding protein [Anaerolineae bacterium]|nr:ABC transporter ATP-binding protein [Anaerolineae bacterium]
MNTYQHPIEVRDLTKTFGTFVAVDHVSFTVNQGEVYGWLGPNGAGKTTTIRMLLGLLKPSGGEARVLGYNPAVETKKMQAQVGYMSQLFTLYNDLTASENIRFYGQAYGLKRQELRRRHDEIIAMAGLQGRGQELTRNLSGGWKQRLALGCAIVHKPRVVFLDEPTAGVDPISRREFWGLIYAMAKEGVTVLVTTHYMDEAELCQRVGFLSKGRLIALDTPDQLKRTQMHGHVLEIDCANSERAARVLRQAKESGLIPFDEIALYGAQIHAVVPDATTFREPVWKLLADGGIDVRAVEWIAPTLEDVFISSVQARGD